MTDWYAFLFNLHRIKLICQLYSVGRWPVPFHIPPCFVNVLTHCSCLIAWFFSWSEVCRPTADQGGWLHVKLTVNVLISLWVDWNLTDWWFNLTLDMYLYSVINDNCKSTINRPWIKKTDYFLENGRSNKCDSVIGCPFCVPSVQVSYSLWHCWPGDDLPNQIITRCHCRHRGAVTEGLSPRGGLNVIQFMRHRKPPSPIITNVNSIPDIELCHQGLQYMYLCTNT